MTWADYHSAMAERTGRAEVAAGGLGSPGAIEELIEVLHDEAETAAIIYRADVRRILDAAFPTLGTARVQ